MQDDAQNAADRRGQISRKLRDLAALLPLVGVIVFASPLISAVAGGGDGALSSAAFYVFASWGALIALAFILSRYLSDTAGRE